MDQQTIEDESFDDKIKKVGKFLGKENEILWKREEKKMLKDMQSHNESSMLGYLWFLSKEIEIVSSSSAVCNMYCYWCFSFL
jgi:hypothetical protein